MRMMLRCVPAALALAVAFPVSAQLDNPEEGIGVPEEPASADVSATAEADTSTGFSSDADTDVSASTGGGAGTAGPLSLSFGIDIGGSVIGSRTNAGVAGLWVLLTDDLNLGLNLAFLMDTDPMGGGTDEELVALGLIPSLRYYLADGEVRPFVAGQVYFEFENFVESEVYFGFGGGLGAEWFVTEIFSLAGHIGLGFDLLRGEDVDPFRIGTFTSLLSAQLYFDL